MGTAVRLVYGHDHDQFIGRLLYVYDTATNTSWPIQHHIQTA